MLVDIQNLDKHPVAETNSMANQVPVIDITDLLSDSSSEPARKAVDEIAFACQTWGFFQVVNHGISTDLIDDVWHQTRRMFSLPNKDKLSILRTKDNPWGYYNNELTKNQRDKKEVFDFTREGVDTIYGRTNRWPAGLSTFKSTMGNYYDACSTLSLKLLEAFCIGLDLPADYLSGDFTNNHTGFVRLNYYPVKDPMANSEIEHQLETNLGVHHHTDAGALTVLLQDRVGGLQVYRNDHWHNISPVTGAMLINTGDMMQVWSNDVYQAAIHRVLAMEAVDRFSIPFFFNPAASCKVSPLPSVIGKQHPSHYHEIEWASFRGKRTDGDYSDYGAEVQISQFRK